jgi:divalent metal cation (Fe/Co/Zn/Cd) transporter
MASYKDLPEISIDDPARRAVCDFLVLVAAHFSKDPADESHPYGHARVETAASALALGAILA